MFPQAVDEENHTAGVNLRCCESCVMANNNVVRQMHTHSRPEFHIFTLLSLAWLIPQFIHQSLPTWFTSHCLKLAEFVF